MIYLYKIALIPTYEPDEHLIKLVKDLKKNNYIVIIVNDGSDSSYNHVFSQIEDATILGYKINHGKGYALKYGLKYIKENYPEFIVVTLDSDGQHTVKDANKLYDYILNNPNDLVLGKRLRSSKTPLRSRIGNSITKLIYYITTGVRIYDTQTGLRSFSNSLVNLMLKIPGNRFEYEMNVLLICPINCVKIHEIEIETIYIDNNSKSHFKTIKDSIKIYKQILIFSLSSIISFIIDYILFILFNIIFNKTIISNILARLISATFNYSFNKEIVFKSKKNHLKAALEYILLASVILFLNVVVLQLLLSIGINKYIAKILTEMILFIFSWFIQKKVIFK